MSDALLDCTARGELVLDPFCGGGATIIAAERIGRVPRAIELDPLYVDAITRRWQDETGKAALCASTGQRFGDISPLAPTASTISVRTRRRPETADV